MTHLKKIDRLDGPSSTIAEIETNPEWGIGKHVGQIWLNSGWLTRDEAIALRDWLNEALS